MSVYFMGKYRCRSYILLCYHSQLFQLVLRLTSLLYICLNRTLLYFTSALTLLHSARPKLFTILAFLSATGLRRSTVFILVCQLFGFNSSFREHFCLYRAVTQRVRKKRAMTGERNIYQPPPSNPHLKQAHQALTVL